MKSSLKSVAIGLLALAHGLTLSPLALAQTPLKIVFGTPPTTYNLPHFVAHDTGMFERAGLKIEDVFVSGDSNAIRGLVSGGADAAGTNLLVAMQAITEGAKITIVGAWQPRVDYQVLVQDRIKSIKDLSTARIATASAGGITQRIPEMLLGKSGFDTKGVNFTSLGGHEARMKAVLADKVDASVVGMLYSARAIKEGRGVRVLTSIANEFPALGFTYLVVLDKDLADPAKRRAIEAYVRAGIVEGSRFIMAEPQKSAAIMQKRATETSVQEIEAILREMNQLKLWGVNGGMESEIIDFSANLASDMGVLKRKLAPGEGLDRSFAEKAVAQLGKM